MTFAAQGESPCGIGEVESKPCCEKATGFVGGWQVLGAWLEDQFDRLPEADDAIAAAGVVDF